MIYVYETIEKLKKIFFIHNDKEWKFYFKQKSMKW